MFYSLSNNIINQTKSAASYYAKTLFSGKSHLRKFSEKPTDSKMEYDNPSELIRHMVVPTDFHKKLLIWSGRYKSLEEIPREITAETLDKVKNKMRIRTCNYMILLTAIGSLIMVIQGRRAAARGESVTQMNIDFHKEMNKKIDQERELAKQALQK